MGTLVLILIICVGLLAWLYSAVALALVATVLAFVSSAFVFGTVYFWLLVVTVSLLVAWSISENPDYDNEDDGGMWSGVAFISVGLSAILIGIVNRDSLLFSDLSIWMKVIAVSGYFVAYLASGAVWSRYKYIKFSKKRLKAIEAWKQEDLLKLKRDYGFESEDSVAEWVKDKEAGKDVKDKEYTKYVAACRYRDVADEGYRRIRPEYNTHRLMVWIGLWPWSIISWLLRDPVKFVYEMMLTFYERVYVSVVGQSQQEFKEKFSSK